MAALSVLPEELPPPRVDHVLPPCVTDEALVVALRAGMPEAANLLFDRYGAYVRRLIVRVIGIDSDVPDLVQEVFVRALERLHTLKCGAALKGWIGSVAIFTTRRHLRDRSTRRRRLRLCDPEALPEREAPSVPPGVSETLRRAYAALESLIPDERVPFALRYVDGMELAEIGAVCGLSLATVKRRIARARSHFGRAAQHDPLLRELVAEVSGIACE